MPSNAEQDPPLPWSAFLDELDQAISEPIELHCIGGFVVSLLYGLPRPTGDVDYVAAIPGDSGEADRHSELIAITVPGWIRSVVGAKRRWRMDFPESDRDRQACCC